jgi:FtsP/CotA-like multicopper oxidase with cupredoxin domain
MEWRCAGDGQPNMPPLFTIQRGKSCVLAVRNETHGGTRCICGQLCHQPKRNRPSAWWRASVRAATQSADLALVADNPGDWMFHCHVTDHQEAGMMSVIRIA